jgi:hypothetical protein
LFSILLFFSNFAVFLQPYYCSQLYCCSQDFLLFSSFTNFLTL